MIALVTLSLLRSPVQLWEASSSQALSNLNYLPKATFLNVLSVAHNSHRTEGKHSNIQNIALT
jgi:hypothetical protein